MKEEHLIKFDVLRGIAIILVFSYHVLGSVFTSGIMINTYENGILTIKGSSAYLVFLTFFPLSYGWAGVHLFLIISGFLIHYSYLKKNTDKLNFGDFINRRFWRIYPPYLICLFVFSFATGNILSTSKGVWDFLSHLFLLHNLSNDFTQSINPSFWSLALEFQLYLLYPLFLFLRKKVGLSATCIIALFVSILLSIFQILFPVLKQPAIELSVFRFWIVWILGAFLAEKYYTNKRMFRINTVGLILMWGSFFVGRCFSFFTIYLIGLYVSFLFIMTIEWYLYNPPKISFPGRLLVNIGLCSYSIYLIHQPYLKVLIRFFNMFNAGGVSFLISSLDYILIFIIFFLIARSMYVYLELPSVQLGKLVYNKIVKRKSQLV
ncbi:acyltransferase [Cytophagaceae bacterium YF14B1]|uniref:Acyltransferase n=1 Tax=Xanthocytophaga flava TaxID=3048013 RepID=A0AAE3QU09_9BACT|nr:acyltransferase [Xanthocytophaga flavus]MDJ1483358.1 acyltransferase [Xanthocytophaga flavus]